MKQAKRRKRRDKGPLPAHVPAVANAAAVRSPPSDDPESDAGAGRGALLPRLPPSLSGSAALPMPGPKPTSTEAVLDLRAAGVRSDMEFR